MSYRLINVSLLELAGREFPRLWNHRTNREDALQTLFLVQFATNGDGTPEAARSALAWLEYELGVVPAKPAFPKPYFPPGNDLTVGTFIRDVDEALERSSRVAA